MSKKKKLIIFAVLSVIVLFLGTFCVFRNIYNEIQRFRYDVIYQKDDFKTKKDSFEIVANKLVAFYDEEKSNNPELERILIVASPSDVWTLECKTKSDKEYTLEKAATDQSVNAFGEVSRFFLGSEQQSLLFIKVTDDRVIFLSNRPCAMVYTRNGARPKYIVSENETYESVFVEKFSSKWFLCAGKK